MMETLEKRGELGAVKGNPRSSQTRPHRNFRPTRSPRFASLVDLISRYSPPGSLLLPPTSQYRMMTKTWMCQRYNPSARDSYTAPADEDEEHYKDALTLRASHATPASRPICTRHSTRPRPQSYHDILEDFQMHARGESVASSVVAPSLGADERASRLERELTRILE